MLRASACYDVLFTVLAASVLCFFSSAPVAAYSGGSGIAGDPFQVATLSDLQELQNTPGDWGSHFSQTTDIDASGTAAWDGGAGWIPVGNTVTRFTGSYDGNGHTIDGLFINRPGIDYQGLFGLIDGTALVENLGLVNINITGNNLVGGLAGRCDGSIDFCYSTGSVSGQLHVGGLVGSCSFGVISNSYSTASVTGSSDVGGLVGDNLGDIEFCFATGMVIGIGDVGGLVGYHDGGSISNCYATGAASGNSFIGGLVGQHSDGDISYSYSTGLVSGTNVGGLIGEDNPPTSPVVVSSFWDRETSGQITSFGGTGKTTAEMQTLSTYTDAGWDFSGTWTVNAMLNNGYPYLTALTPPSQPIPTLSEWGLIILAFLLAGSGFWVVRRRHWA